MSEMSPSVAIKTLDDMWDVFLDSISNSTFDDLKEHGMMDNYSIALNMAKESLSRESKLETTKIDVSTNIVRA